MAEEVVIKVRQQGEGNALSEAAAKMEQLKAKIAELNRLEKNYTEKGLPQAAASTRTERIPFARELRDLQREQRTAEKEEATHEKKIHGEKRASASEQAAHEKAITTEHREQASVVKARDSKLRRLGSAVANQAEGALGVSGGGGITSALGAIGGPIGLAIGVALAGAAKLFSASIEDSQGRARASAHVGSERSADVRSGQLQAGWRGTSGGVRSSQDQTIEQLAGLKDEEKELQLKSEQFSAFDPRGWSNSILGTNFQTWGGQSDLAHNKEEQQRLTQKQAEEEKLGNAKFNTEEGGLGLQAQRARTEGRYKEAIALGMESSALKAYREVKAAHGSDSQAEEAAQLSVKQQKLDYQRSLGHLVGARDGRANIAAVASLGASFPDGGVEAAVHKLIGVVNTNSADAKNAMTRANFTQP